MQKREFFHADVNADPSTSSKVKCLRREEVSGLASRGLRSRFPGCICVFAHVCAAARGGGDAWLCMVSVCRSTADALVGREG